MIKKYFNKFFLNKKFHTLSLSFLFEIYTSQHMSKKILTGKRH